MSFNDIGLMDELEKNVKYVPTCQLIEQIRKDEQAINKEKIAKYEQTIKNAINSLLEKELTIEQIATILNLSVKEVNQISKKNKGNSMNIAILVGVSKYHNGISNLPGCENDIKTMAELLEASSKYTYILTFSKSEDSQTIKDSIATFINGHKGKNIEEIFFYFSGHGDYAEDEFYYILSDFDQNKRIQTSLQNSELDTLMKSLSPQLVVKVVDACHSGINYIKDSSLVNKYIEKTKQEFKSCYFIYSSLNTQSSFQNKDFSFFTISFFAAIKNLNSKVRYKDIISYIADDFLNHSEQTPYFVVQADYTEVFCDKNEKIEKILENINFEIPVSKNKVESHLKLKKLEDIIKYDSKKYVTEKDLKELLNQIKEKVEKYEVSDELKSIYTIRSVFSNKQSQDINYEIIGDFLHSQKNKWFARPIFKEVQTKRRIVPTHFEMISNPKLEPYYETETSLVVNGYGLLTSSLPYSQILVEYESDYPNVSMYKCSIVFIINDVNVRLYYFISNYIKNNWNSYSLNSRYEWNVEEFELIKKEEILEFIEKINNNITNRIFDDLKSLREQYLDKIDNVLD